MSIQSFSGRGKSWRLGIAGVATACALLLGGCSSTTPAQAPESSSGKALTPITVNLDWVPTGRMAGFYYGVESGIYKRAGLDVKVVPGTGTGPTLQQLVSKNVDFAFVKIPSVFQEMAEHPKPVLKIYATLYSEYPGTFFYFKGGDIKTPDDLEGKKVASSAGSDIVQFVSLFADANHFDASKINWVNMDGGAKVAALLTNKVDATTTDLMALPAVEAGAQGREVGTFTYGKMGVDMYGNGIVGRADFEKAHPKVTAAFVAASVEAWKEAFANPDKAIAAMQTQVPEMDPKIGLAELKIVNTLAMGPEQKKNGLGYMSAEKMQASYDAITKTMNLPISTPLKELYTNDFLTAKK